MSFPQTRASDGLYVKIDASFYLNTLYVSGRLHSFSQEDISRVSKLFEERF